MIFQALIRWYLRSTSIMDTRLVNTTDDTQLTIATIQSVVQNGEIVISDIASSISELWRHHSVIGPGGACTQAAERYLATGDHRDMGSACWAGR